MENHQNLIHQLYMAIFTSYVNWPEGMQQGDAGLSQPT